MANVQQILGNLPQCEVYSVQNKQDNLYRVNFKAQQPDMYVRKNKENDDKHTSKNKLKKHLTNSNITTAAFLGMFALSFAMFGHQMGWFTKKINLYDQCKNLTKDISIKTVDNCKTISKEMQHWINEDIKLWNCPQEIFTKAGKPKAVNSIVVIGAPGIGKSFYPQILAKSGNAKYLELKYTDIASEYVSKGARNFSTIFKSIGDMGAKKPDEKFIIVFNESDTFLSKVSKASKNASEEMKADERAAVLVGMEYVQKVAPNVKFVFTTNIKQAHLDPATMDRMGAIRTLKAPTKDLLKNGLIEDLTEGNRAIPGFKEYIQNHMDEIDKLAEAMEKRKCSHRDRIMHIQETAKRNYLLDLCNNKEKEFTMDYLTKALDEIEMTAGESYAQEDGVIEDFIRRGIG